MHRPSFDQIYIEIAQIIAKRSPDYFTQVGCVATNSKNELIGASYNGFMPKYEPDFDISQNRDKKNILVLHAEQNVTLRHPRGEIQTLYLTHSCCNNCAKLVAGHGVKRVVYLKEYHREQGCKEIFKEYGVIYEKYKG
jgi:dCMP deaminase